MCDSSSLISLSETCNLGVLRFLKQNFDADFVIPQAVEREIIERPSKVGKFSYSAARIKHLISENTLRVAWTKSLSSEAQKILSQANNLFFEKKPLTIVQEGEAECLALMKPLRAQALLIDEKTTRLLLEDPKKLFTLMRGEQAQVKADEKALSAFQKTYSCAMMRSTELLAFGAQNGFFNDYAPDENEVFHSSIYALRYAGCSISQKEIDDYQKIKI